MIILGISSFIFDSSACILIDGKLIAAAQEERFTREKNTGVFPEKAIRFCLEQNNLAIEDIDHVAFYWKPFEGIVKRGLQIIRNLPNSLLFWDSHASRWTDMVNCENILKIKFPGNHRFEFHNVSHHLAHAASGFFVSPYKNANILVMDGAGEIASTSLCHGQENNLKISKSINFPYSMGYLYVSLTHFLGFKPDNDEYKVMALASMGGHSQYYDLFCQIISLRPSGGYIFDLSYFNYQKGIRDPWVSKKFIKEFGEIRKKDQPLQARHYNIAWALQKRLEDVAIHCTDYMQTIHPSENLIVTGGCGLNCKMNEVIVKHGSYKNIWVNSVPHDAGACVGAAFWIENYVFNRPRKFVFKSALLGPEFTDSEIEIQLQKAGLKYNKLSSAQLIQNVAQKLREKKIIGWFQGRTEFGPRALGNRSILADPTFSDMKDIINSKIKHREPFRPFAPAIAEDSLGEFFEEERSLPFMSFILKVKNEGAKKIPSVVHIDNTARVQTVDRDTNEKFYLLIKEFEKLSGVPVLLNTSFNDNGEPIVNNPKDAIASFKSTGLDCMAMGNFLVERA